MAEVWTTLQLFSTLDVELDECLWQLKELKMITNVHTVRHTFD
jgi:hypothetical protein